MGDAGAASFAASSLPSDAGAVGEEAPADGAAPPAPPLPAKRSSIYSAAVKLPPAAPTRRASVARALNEQVFDSLTEAWAAHSAAFDAFIASHQQQEGGGAGAGGSAPPAAVAAAAFSALGGGGGVGEALALRAELAALLAERANMPAARGMFHRLMRLMSDNDIVEGGEEGGAEGGAGAVDAEDGPPGVLRPASS